MKRWDIEKKRVVHENPYFCVVEESFRLKSGETGKYYLLQQPDFVAAVAVEKGQLYFVEMERYALKRKLLEIPMGGIEAGETPLSAAKRELREETGITAKRWRKIGRSESFKGRCDQRFTIFIAEELAFGEQELDVVEAEGGARVVKLAIREVSALIAKGKITDAHTLAAFQLFMLNYKGSK
jgi:8-oxo-dGTP pyrophosphatase MutT (NUDIX family)